jgi:hemerythrin-like domain-containing protein
MSTIKSFLSADHKACDELFADTENAIVVSKWDEAKAGFEKLNEAFEKHFRMEEAVMFVEFERGSGMSCGPTQVMRMEHEQMRKTLAQMGFEIGNAEKSKALGLCETFNMLVQQHNSKEEQMLYTMADNILSSQAEEIIERMKGA